MTTQVTHVTEIAHARLGASGAPSWTRCPTWQGGGASTIYAAQGSVIHEVAADALSIHKPVVSRIGEVFHSGGFDITFSLDMAGIASKYVDHCTDLANTLGGEVLVETSLPIDQITGEPNAVSTIDFGLLPGPGSTQALLVDLKTGAGVAVSADTEQMIMYALALYDEYSLVYDIQTVRVMIIQPPLDSITERVYTIDELEVWRKTFADAAALAMSDNPTPVPGDKQCRFCTKKADCNALTAVVFESLDTVVPDDADASHLAIAMSRVDMIEHWCKAVRAETEKRLLDGHPVAGWKLVQGKRGNRQWTDKDAAEAMLKTMRVPHDKMYDYSVISPTSADKLAKAEVIGPRQWPKLAALITQADGKPSVAPESDKRPALVLDAVFEPLEEEVTT